MNTWMAPPSQPLSEKQIDAALTKCLELQNTGVTLHSKRPFAALLLAPDNTTVLLTHLSISHFQHAESELARLAATQYDMKYLQRCTLVSTWEPCAMCTGTLYWANIGRLLYAASEEELNKLTGAGNGENMTMSLPCRDVLSHGQKDVDVTGPVPRWQERVVHDSAKWWKEHATAGGAAHPDNNNSNNSNGRSSVNGNGRSASVLSSLHHGDDDDDDDPTGGYSADLQIDWLR